MYHCMEGEVLKFKTNFNGLVEHIWLNYRTNRPGFRAFVAGAHPVLRLTVVLS